MIDTRPGELGTREAEKIAKALTKVPRTNKGIVIGGGIGAWISLISLTLNVGALFIVGGKYMQRLEAVERSQQEQQAINREVAQHSVEIAVTASKLEDIKASVDRIERAVNQRAIGR